MSDNIYPKNPRSTVNRLRGRAAYDYETIHGIVNTCPIVHVSFTPSPDDSFPAILPMLGAMGSFESPQASLSDAPLNLYLHGYVSSRLMRLPSSSEATEDGLPICIAASHFDGIVLALSPFHHSLNYRSAVLHGYATLVASEPEKLYAMELITNNMVPKRWDNCRAQPLKTEMQSTSILKVTIVSASAKVRVGGANEDRKDEKDENVRGKFWTGVIPAWTAFGEPVPAEANRVAAPEHITDFVATGNKDGERKAKEAVKAQNK